MQANIMIHCEGCGAFLGRLRIDTADMPDELQQKINGRILEHRPMCTYYGLSEVDSRPGWKQVVAR